MYDLFPIGVGRGGGILPVDGFEKLAAAFGDGDGDELLSTDSGDGLRVLQSPTVSGWDWPEAVGGDSCVPGARVGTGCGVGTVLWSSGALDALGGAG